MRQSITNQTILSIKTIIVLINFYNTKLIAAGNTNTIINNIMALYHMSESIVPEKPYKRIKPII